MKQKSVFLTIAVLLGLRITATAQTPPSYVPTDGLIGWWPFNGNANDESGNGNNGTVNGATLTEDRFGNGNAAYGFGGINDSIVISELDNSSNWSLSFWYYTPSDSNFSFQYIFGFGTSSPSSYGLPGFGLIGENTSFKCGTLEQNRALITDAITECSSINWLPNTEYGVWYYNTIVKEGENYSVYWNGQLEWSGAMNTITLNKLKIGSRLENWLDFNGIVDDIGMWNRTLTQAEITSLYNSSTPSGIDATDNRRKLFLFPNPTNNQLTINYGDFASLAGYTLKIFNAIGQEIHSANINQEQEVLQLDTWGGPGTYQVVIYNAQGVPVDTRTIVLQ